MRRLDPAPSVLMYIVSVEKMLTQEYYLVLPVDIGSYLDIIQMFFVESVGIDVVVPVGHLTIIPPSALLDVAHQSAPMSHIGSFIG